MNIIKKNQVAPKRKKREKKMTKWLRYKKYEQNQEKEKGEEKMTKWSKVEFGIYAPQKKFYVYLSML